MELTRCLSWTASPEVEREEFYCIGRDVTRQREMEAALRGKRRTLAVGAARQQRRHLGLERAHP